MTRQMGRVVTAAVVAFLAALETLAWAQAPAPAPPPSDGIGVAVALGSIVAFLALVVVLVRMFDRKRRRDEEDMALEARISDAMLSDPALSGLPVTAHVKRSGLGESAATTVAVTGRVPSAQVNDAVLALVAREVAAARPEAHVESHLELDGAHRRAA